MDDFGDFTSFSDFTNSNATNNSQETLKESSAKGVDKLNDAELSFSAFQGNFFTQAEGEAGMLKDIPNFANFSQFGTSEAGVHEVGGVLYEIPPIVTSPTTENFHIAGGVPFEIPPLPDDFSFDNALEDLSTFPEPTSVVETSNTRTMTIASTGADPEGGVQSHIAFPPTSLSSHVDNLEFNCPTTEMSFASIQTGPIWKADFSDFSTNYNPSKESTCEDLVSSSSKEDRFDTGTTSHAINGSVEVNNNIIVESGKSKTTTADDFGEFEGFSKIQTATTTTGDDDFGEFGGGSGQQGRTGDGFEEFSANSVTTAAGNDFGEFGGFIGSSEISAAKSESGVDNFGEFGGFNGVQVTTTTTTTTTTGDDGFGEFGGFAEAETGGGEFGEFEGFVEAESGGDEFGEFSSNATCDLSKNKSESRSAPLGPPGKIKEPRQSSADILEMCFVEVTDSSLSLTGSCTLSKALLEPNTTSEHNQSLWLVLQNCIDLTIPLHKFDKSYLQNCYYRSLSVDPMLTSKPLMASILSGMAKFEDPLGGATAIEDLRESFGFEGNLLELGSTPTEVSGSDFRRTSEEYGAALLDLSLPLSPNSPTRDSFTLTADLAGLDLNPMPQVEKQLTSIQELLLNERLVVNRSTWMDSQLANIGGEGLVQGEHENNSQPNTPRMVAKSVELQLQQLGLDASKTTLSKTSSAELSLTARSVLGRLPDLSFMLFSDKMENTHYSKNHP